MAIDLLTSQSGDVEDAPALDPLSKFELTEEDGAVFIKGDEQTIKASRRQPNTKCAAQGQEKVVVVGGGSGMLCSSIEESRIGERCRLGDSFQKHQ